MSMLIKQRALRKFKFMTISFFVLFAIAYFAEADSSYVHEGTDFDMELVKYKGKGYILEYTNKEDFCHR